MEQQPSEINKYARDLLSQPSLFGNINCAYIQKIFWF